MGFGKLNCSLGLACAFCALLFTLPASAAAPTHLYFSDDFGGKHSFFEGALDQRKFRYVDGQYEIDTTAASAYGQSVLQGDLDAYRVQATAQMSKAGDGSSGFGLTLNYRGRSGGSPDFVLFFVYDAGAYTVLRYIHDKTEVLAPVTRTKLFAPGAAVELMADNDHGALTFYINGVEAAAVTEHELTSGGFGLFTSPKSIARFDDFKVFADSVGGFTDSFEGERVLYQGDWGEVSYKYSGGRYVIDTTNRPYNGLSPYPQPATDLEFSADVDLLAGRASGTAGLYFRDHENPDGTYNQFRFLVSPGDPKSKHGWFVVERTEGDKPLALSQSVESAAVNKHGVNRLKLHAQAGELVFYVNDQEVYRTTDSAPASGAYGFFASSGVAAAFDNARYSPVQ